MKRTTIIIILFLLLVPAFVTAKQVMLEVKLSYFSPSDSVYRDIYSGSLAFGVEGTYAVTKNFHAWAGVSFLSAEGELTYTREETKMSLVPIGFGIKYIHPSESKMTFFGALGLNLNIFNEDNFIGKVNQTKLGLVIRAGGLYNVSEKFFLSIFADFSTCKMKPADYKFDVGGFQIGLGVGIKLGESQ